MSISDHHVTIWKFPVVNSLAAALEKLNPLLSHDDSDPAGVDEFRARWYLHPVQHVVEIVVSIIIFAPLLYLSYTRMVRQLRDLKIRYEPSRTQVLWSYGLLMTLILQAPLKLDPENWPSHPAYFLQPCHVSAVLYFLITLIPSETSFIAFHSLSLLTWGPFLAFVFPNFPATSYEVVFFWLQHVFLVTAPFFACGATHKKLYNSLAWNYWPMVVIAAYHWWTLIPWSVWTGVNVATMLVPPPALISFKKYYRPVQLLATVIMHTISILAHMALCRLVEQGNRLKRRLRKLMYESV